MGKATNVIGVQPNWMNIADMVNQGFIRQIAHPEDESLLLHNYTQSAQFDQKWTRDTLMCRGLISRDGKVVARPFSKFFNYSEFDKSHSNVLKGPWEVLEKMDGSLGILYQFAADDWRIATRGAFESEQAVWATEWLATHHPDFRPREGATWLFEIIYPSNRIVVDYGDKEGLVLLDVLDTKTGERVAADDHPFEVCEFHGVFDGIPESQRSNKEGFVLVNAKDFRVKIKHEEYVRLHKLITGCSSRMIWEYLKDGLSFDELIENVPDEFYNWMTKTRESLEAQFNAIEYNAKSHFDQRPDTENRKELAEYFKEHENPHICFSMIDGKDYAEGIWKMIKPERELPFVIEA